MPRNGCTDLIASVLCVPILSEINFAYASKLFGQYPPPVVSSGTSFPDRHRQTFIPSLGVYINGFIIRHFVKRAQMAPAVKSFHTTKSLRIFHGCGQSIPVHWLHSSMGYLSIPCPFLLLPFHSRPSIPFLSFPLFLPFFPLTVIFIFHFLRESILYPFPFHLHCPFIIHLHQPRQPPFSFCVLANKESRFRNWRPLCTPVC